MYRPAHAPPPPPPPAPLSVKTSMSMLISAVQKFHLEGKGRMGALRCCTSCGACCPLRVVPCALSVACCMLHAVRCTVYGWCTSKRYVEVSSGPSEPSEHATDGEGAAAGRAPRAPDDERELRAKARVVAARAHGRLREHAVGREALRGTMCSPERKRPLRSVARHSRERARSAAARTSVPLCVRFALLCARCSDPIRAKVGIAI
jgi:hypothetical protein